MSESENYQTSNLNILEFEFTIMTIESFINYGSTLIHNCEGWI